MVDPPTEQTDRRRTLQAVPVAGPKRTEATRPARACAAHVKTHDSPRSPPDLRTDGYTLSARVQSHLPTDLLGHGQPLLAGSQRECREVDVLSERGRASCPHPEYPPTPPEPDTEPLQLHSFPS